MHGRDINSLIAHRPEAQQTILVAEESADDATLIRNTFAKAGYRVFLISDISGALEISAKRWIDMLIVNIESSSQDKIAVCREMRKTALIPVIALAANHATSHQLEFLIDEADDYLAKPYSPNELLVRAELIMRKQRNGNWRESVVAAGDIILDTDANIVLIGKSAIDLTPNECQLLSCLMHKPGQVVRKEEIIQAVWQNRFYHDSNALRVTMRRLRHKIEQNPAQPGYLLTVYGIGYKLRTATQFVD